MPDYQVPQAPVQCEMMIEKSRFITDLHPVADRASAEAFVKSIKAQHPQANHCSSAFIAGAPWYNDVLAASDDGEPAGTAGRPMLAVLQGAGVGEIAVVVTRYFGGIKLGTGGLVRAYSQAVREALAQTQWLTRVPQVLVTLVVDYADWRWLESWLSQQQVTVVEQQFHGAIDLRLSVPQDKHTHIQQQLYQRSQGRLSWQVVD